MEIMDVAVPDIVVKSSEVERAAVRHSQAGHLATLWTGRVMSKFLIVLKLPQSFARTRS